MVSTNVNYASIYDGTTWWLKTVTITSSTVFTFNNTGIGSAVPTDWAFVGYEDDATGDLVFADQAPLIVSGVHVVSVV